jgi:hypothetical protein
MVPLHDALQLWCSVIFAVVTLVLWRRMVRQRAVWHWRGAGRPGGVHCAEHRLPRMPRRHGLWIIRLMVVVATLGAATGHRLREHEGAKTALAGTAFGGITFSLGAAVLLAVALRRNRARAGLAA